MGFLNCFGFIPRWPLDGAQILWVGQVHELDKFVLQAFKN